MYNGSHFRCSHQISALKSVSGTIPKEVKFLKFDSDKVPFFNRACLFRGLPNLTPTMTKNLQKDFFYDFVNFDNTSKQSFIFQL